MFAWCLMFAPAATFALGILLAIVLQCDGPHELRCKVGSTGNLVLALWLSPVLSFITMPAGALMLAFLRASARRAHKKSSDTLPAGGPSSRP